MRVSTINSQDTLRKTTIEQCLKEGFAPPSRRGEFGSSIREAARRLKCGYSTLGKWATLQEKLATKGKPNHRPDWNLWPGNNANPAQEKEPIPVAAQPRKVHRYLLTGCQAHTDLHMPFWRNLQAYSKELNAPILVGPCFYRQIPDHGPNRESHFAEEAREFLCFDSLDLGNFIFHAPSNLLLTAVNPLTGLLIMDNNKWAAYAHPRLALQSVVRPFEGQPKFLATTGMITVPNYNSGIAGSKAAEKARFHHVVGAMIVEIDQDGDRFFRQLNASDDGSFQDLDIRVHKGKVSRNNRVEAITWGDIHAEKPNADVAEGSWGVDVATFDKINRRSMLDVLQPKAQFFHDLIDFTARNHHSINDPIFRYKMRSKETDTIINAFNQCLGLLNATNRKDCRSVVLQSNHDNAYTRWLKDSSGHLDSNNSNIKLWYKANYDIRVAIDEGNTEVNPFELTLRAMRPDVMKDVVFVQENQSCMIGGIEHGMHGHIGPNGARGSANNMRTVSVKISRGHDHSPSIRDGVYTVGISGNLDQQYNKGPTSWAHSHIVLMPNGKRQIVTVTKNKWRAT